MSTCRARRSAARTAAVHTASRHTIEEPMSATASLAVKSVLVAVLMGSALGASVTAASADVVPGTEDGWGTPPGGVTLSVVGDDLDDQGRSPKFPESISKASFRVKLDPPLEEAFSRTLSRLPERGSR